MTEVEYQPRKKVIIHEYSRYNNVDELIRNAFGNAPSGSSLGPIKWVDGVVMINSSYPLRDTIIQELLEGRLHWDHVSFAPMEKYENTIHIQDLRLTVSITNVTSNPIFRLISKFIKETLMTLKE